MKGYKNIPKRVKKAAQQKQKRATRYITMDDLQELLQEQYPVIERLPQNETLIMSN